MNMCPSYKRKVPPELCLKGQVFFIWSNQQILHFAQEQISLLGGRVETFLSKDITTILIEDTHLVAATQYFQTDLALYNLPSTSRGYNLLAASAAINSPIRIIAFATQWGIQVLGIGYFLQSIDPIVKSVSHLIHHPKKSQNVSNLTGCYIKFECFQKKFRPCYKMFNSDPERLMPLRNANILVKPENCNVILDKPIAPRQLPFNHMNPNDRALYNAHESKPPMKVNDKKFPNKLKPKEENNYCECCRTHFSDLKHHIRSANHQRFVSNEKNYETVHSILKMLPSAQEFIQKHQKPAQTSDLILQNGEAIHSMNTNSVTRVDFSMPLDSGVKKVGSLIAPNFPEKCEESSLPLNLQLIKKDVVDEDSMPLNLHMKRNEEIKEEPPFAKMGTCTILANEEAANSVCKSEIDVVGLKTDSPQENDLLESKINIKDICIPETTNVLPNDTAVPAADPLFDKTNTAALAQLCLKNFDSYWLDSLPCEMDDIMFDDNIFDFDDGKQKLCASEQTECVQPVGNFSPSDMPHSPGLVSGISTDIKMQSTVNTSLLITSPTDINDSTVKTESVNAHESYSPVCKTELDYKDSLSPENLRINESLINEKKLNFSGSFDIKTNPSRFYDDKQDMDVNPPCSNAMAGKSSEQMFSSDSSDDENENVFISNVLNIITTNSDNEMKIDRESCEEDSVLNSKSSARYKKRQTCSSKTGLTPVKNTEQSCAGNKEKHSAGATNMTCSNETEQTCTNESDMICASNVEQNCTNNAVTISVGSVKQTFASRTICASNSDKICAMNDMCISNTDVTEKNSTDLHCANDTELTPVNLPAQSCVNKTVHISLNNIQQRCSSKEKIHTNSEETICTEDKISITEEKISVDLQSTNTMAQSSLELPKRQKILHKRSVRKLRKLPSLWSVCILPGKGLKLKFTCVQPESFVRIESDNKKGVALSEPS